MPYAHQIQRRQTGVEADEHWQRMQLEHERQRREAEERERRRVEVERQRQKLEDEARREAERRAAIAALANIRGRRVRIDPKVAKRRNRLAW